MKKKTYELVLDDFLKLPRRCQELFFEMMERSTTKFNNEYNPYMQFYINGFNYDNCDSPIEKIFAFAFDIVLFAYEEDNFYLDPQAKIIANGKTYYADFLFDTAHYSEELEIENDFKLIVECDGHEYHKLTKRQVKHDNERDMDIKIAGYDVLHFSGSQIYENPEKCAQDTFLYIKSKIGKVRKL